LLLLVLLLMVLVLVLVLLLLLLLLLSPPLTDPVLSTAALWRSLPLSRRRRQRQRRELCGDGAGIYLLRILPVCGSLK